MEKEIRSGIIDIIILFYNKVDQTIACINSFLPSEQHIYVLNNGSSEKDFVRLQKLFESNEQVYFLNAGRNLGPAGGRNYLIKHTRQPWLFFVDNDITIKPERGWMSFMDTYLNKYPNAEIICPRIYNVHESAYMGRLKIHLSNGVLELKPELGNITNFFPEGGAMVKRTVFERIGLYDEEMFAFEGYELALRALLAAHGPLEVHHIDSIVLIHDHRYQKDSKDKEAVRQRYNDERMKASYDRMVQKYGIAFDHDWRWWTNRQLYVMTAGRLRKLKDSFLNRVLFRNK